MADEKALTIDTAKKVVAQVDDADTLLVGAGIRSNVGPLAIKPEANSTAAILLTNAAGTTLASVDTTNGRAFIGGASVPTARLHVGAGAAAANSGAVKLTSGTILTVPEAGSLEYDGTWYLTNGSGTRSPISLGTFGDNFQNVAAEATTTTTSAVFQSKVTLTTPALTGTYRVAFYCEIASGTANTRAQARLFNSTDATELCFSETRMSLANLFACATGFQYVTFTGAAKSFIVQFASQGGVATVSCRRARIEFWRVS